MSAVSSKKTVLITGCSPGGIGHSLAHQFHARGLHVIATARDRLVLSDLEELGMTTISLEVTNASNIALAKQQISALTGGKLDILVNNAGVNCTVPASEVSMEAVRQTFEVNLFAVIAMTQAFLPLLIESKGLIVNIGSLAGVIPYVFGSVYNASKAALHSYSATLRLEVEPFDVRVMVVVTGGVKSNIARLDRRLVEGSLYVDVEALYRRRVKHSQEVGVDSVGYAREVVGEALRVRPRKWVYKGRYAGLVGFVAGWLGLWVFDLVLPRMFGLNTLGRILRARKKA